MVNMLATLLVESDFVVLILRCKTLNFHFAYDFFFLLKVVSSFFKYARVFVYGGVLWNLTHLKWVFAQ